MMELSVLSTTISEPVTVEDVKSFMGYTETDQDDIIQNMITVARQWLENRTGLSCVSKSYKAYFEKEDRDPEGWYELPMVPVLSTPAITVSVTGTSSTFQQKGLRKVRVKPDTVIGTLRIGATTDIFYVEITFQAGEYNETANECIKRIVSSMFNEREDGSSESGNVSASRLAYDTIRLIETIDQNTGL